MKSVANKHFYEAPSAEIFTVATESVVCASPLETAGAPTYNGFNAEQEW